MKTKIFNAIQSEIERKNYNVFIGISVGIKPLTKKLAKEFIEWSLEHTKEKVAILIADEIAKINYRVFSHYSELKSLKRAMREGDKYESFFRDVLSDLPEGQKNRIVIIRWKDILTERFKEVREILEREFKKNKGFRNRIMFFVNEYANRRNKNLTEEQLTCLAGYILSELPTLLDGIEFDRVRYRLVFYPTFIHSGMSDLATHIQNAKIFPNLREKLNLKDKTVMVEAFID